MRSSPLSVVRTEASQFYKNIHLSIYIPIAKEGNGSFQSRNKVRYCMSLKKIEKKLLDKGIAFLKIRELLTPLERKLESGIWRRNCSGVAIFFRSGVPKIFSYDVSLPQTEVISEDFYLEPLEKLPSETRDKIKAALHLWEYNDSEYFTVAGHSF